MKDILKKFLSVAVTLVFVISMVAVGRGVSQKTGGEALPQDDGLCVVIDAGHGGDDPGKVGVDNVLEKDINLQIALILKTYLENEGIRVVMTREDEGGLYDADASNKKVQDMKRRIEVIDATKPDITVSIHQNSYPEEYVHGAQVFYYTDSAEGKLLAEEIQAQLIEKADPENTRVIKANDSYYMLKKTSVPIVIVECGFLSNREETKKLCTAEYQDRIAWAVHLGIVRYLEEQK
jgi:N-acetylmuramoyl-L-alanine amidase